MKLKICLRNNFNYYKLYNNIINKKLYQLEIQINQFFNFKEEMDKLFNKYNTKK